MTTMKAVERDDVTVEERLAAVEAASVELFNVLFKSGKAINRSEMYIFSLVKLCMDKGVLTVGDLENAGRHLANEEDLGEFWTRDLSQPPVVKAKEEEEEEHVTH